MPSAYVTVVEIAFPERCTHCSRPADDWRKVWARSPSDMIFGAHETASVWVPVCRDADRRRTWLGPALLAGNVLLVFLLGLLAVALSMDTFTTPAIAAFLLAVALVLPMRGGLHDTLADWRALGFRAWWPSRTSSRIRVWFRSERYFSEWMAMNATASNTADGPRWEPPVRGGLDAPENAFMYSRQMPALLLCFTLVVITLHHLWASRGGRVLFAALAVAMGGAFLSLGAMVYPPVLWSIGIYGRGLPLKVKIAGAVLAGAGLIAGVLLGLSYPRH